MEVRKSKYFEVSFDNNCGQSIRIECPRLNQILEDTLSAYKLKRIEPLILDQIAQELDLRFVNEFINKR
jgi:hypothetical protein